MRLDALPSVGKVQAVDESILRLGVSYTSLKHSFYAYFYRRRLVAAQALCRNIPLTSCTRGRCRLSARQPWIWSSQENEEANAHGELLFVACQEHSPLLVWEAMLRSYRCEVSLSITVWVKPELSSDFVRGRDSVAVTTMTQSSSAQGSPSPTC